MRLDRIIAGQPVLPASANSAMKPKDFPPKYRESRFQNYQAINPDPVSDRAGLNCLLAANQAGDSSVSRNFLDILMGRSATMSGWKYFVGWSRLQLLAACAAYESLPLRACHGSAISPSPQKIASNSGLEP